MRALAKVKRPCFAVHPSRANSSNVVCIDFLPDTVEETLVHDKGSGPGRQGFGKSDGYSTVQHTSRLLGSMVDRHSTSQVVGTRLQNFNAKVPVPTFLALLVDEFKWKGGMPNRFR